MGQHGERRIALHPELKELLADLGEKGMPEVSAMSSVAEARAFARTMSAQAPRGPRLARVTDFEMRTEVGTIRARHYVPSNGDRPTPAIVYFHGGGWVIGDIDFADTVVRTLAKWARIAVVSVEYRLAPEHRFPAAADDAFAATAWVATHAAELGIRSDRLAVGGDSAGGNLAAGVAQRAAEGGPELCFQLLISPVLVADFTQPSYVENGAGYLLTAADMEWYWDQYAPHDWMRSDPMASPLQAHSLRGLPAAHIVTAGFDPLRDEGNAYAERLEGAGVAVSHREYPDMTHDFVMLPLRCARRGLRDIAVESAAVLHAPRPMHGRVPAAAEECESRLDEEVL